MSFHRWSKRALIELAKQKPIHPVHSQPVLRDLALRIQDNETIVKEWKSILTGTSGTTTTAKQSSSSSISPKPSGSPTTDARIIISSAALMKPYTATKSTELKVQKALSNVDRLLRLHRDTQEMARHVGELPQSHPSSPTTHNKKNQSTLPSLIGSTFRQIRDRHQHTIETVAEIVVGLRSSSMYNLIQESVDPFLRNRLGIPLLCEHIMEIDKGKETGTMDVDVQIYDVVMDAVSEAKILVEAHYGDHQIPDIQVQDPAMVVTLHRPWLHYVLVELLKNAMTATIENQGSNIQITFGQNDKFVFIFIDDQGAGLNCDNGNRDIFAFAQTEKLWDRLDDQTTYAMVRSPLKGLGVGLSQSRMIVQHFGGNLTLKNLDNRKGCRASIQIAKDLDIPEQV